MILKNLTPRQIALYSSLAITLLFSLFLAIFKVAGSQWSVLLILLPAFFVLAYFVIIYGLTRYIYRKVKLIYKNIHQRKLSRKDKDNNLLDPSKDIMGDVEQEVKIWADEQNRKIESLKTLETYRRNFLGNVSHELKTPIFSMQGYIHTLLDGGLYDDKINRNYLNRAAKNVERLHTIVEDLESISRMESGELVLDLESFDIKELSKEVIEDMEFMAKERSIRIMEKEDAYQAFMVRADRENIRQVFNNLLINSIKYGKKNGITKVGFYDMESYILVEVSDNGIGIDEAHLSHVFDRFYRADKSRSREQGGSGLGLSIVKHIIDAHQQTVNVRSTPKLGSTFGFTLQKVK